MKTTIVLVKRGSCASEVVECPELVIKELSTSDIDTIRDSIFTSKCSLGGL